MKKNRITLMLLITITTLFISCETEIDILDINEESIKIENNELKFASIESYETMLNNGQLTTKGIQDKLGDNYTHFSSLYKKMVNEKDSKTNKELYGFNSNEDSPIFNILNENETVTIGKWTFMIDLAKEIVGVVESSKTDLRLSLKYKDFNNSNIKWFGTEDDVILLLEEGNQGTLVYSEIQNRIDRFNKKQHTLLSSKKMNNDPCYFYGGLDSTTNILKDKKVFISEAQCGNGFECERWLADAKHVYQKAGVYFSLQSKIKYRGDVPCVNNAPYAINTNLTANVRYYYERRRRFKKNIKKSGNPSISRFDNVVNIRSYEGSRSLKHYTLNSTFTYRRKDDCASQFNCSVPNPIVTITLPQIKR